MIVRGGKGAEVLNHADLLDMPDLTGSNTDHDNRYVNIPEEQDITGAKTFTQDTSINSGKKLILDA